MDISTKLRQPSVTYKLSESNGKVIATAYWQGKNMGVYIEIPEEVPSGQTLLPQTTINEAAGMYRTIRERTSHQSDKA